MLFAVSFLRGATMLDPHLLRFIEGDPLNLIVALVVLIVEAVVVELVIAISLYLSLSLSQ